jgi:hypothetical protein
MSTQLEVLNEYYARHPERNIRANDYLLLNESARPVLHSPPAPEHVGHGFQSVSFRALETTPVQRSRSFFWPHLPLTSVAL